MSGLVTSSSWNITKQALPFIYKETVIGNYPLGVRKVVTKWILILGITRMKKLKWNHREPLEAHSHRLPQIPTDYWTQAEKKWHIQIVQKGLAVACHNEKWNWKPIGNLRGYRIYKKSERKSYFEVEKVGYKTLKIGITLTWF